jgi:serpin B
MPNQQSQTSFNPKPKSSMQPSDFFPKMIKILNKELTDSTGTENAFYSPMSIGVAMAMVYEGTDKKLRSDFEQILGFNPDEVYRSYTMEDLDSLLSSAAPDPNAKKGAFQLTVGNSLWNASHCQLQPAFVSSLKTKFKAYCEALNTEDPNGCCDKVNAYISNKTAGMIKNMLSPKSFGPDLLLI